MANFTMRHVPAWYYNWFMKKAERSDSICLCGCTRFWRAHYELFMFLVFKRNY